MTRLTDEQVAEARRLWATGDMNLGEIARELGCSIYDLSPWLYAHETQDDER